LPAVDTVRGDETGYDIGRLLAFSDAVFAIAITLLVLNLPIPHLTGTHDRLARQLPGALLGIGPRLGAFALSFYLVGFYWIRHHRICRRLRRVDRNLLLLNLLILFLVCLVPFTAGVISQWGDTVVGGEVYAANLAAIGIVYGLVRWYGHGASLLDEPPLERRQIVEAVLFPGLFVAFMAVAPISLVWAYAIWAGFLLPRGLLTRVLARTARRVEERPSRATAPGDDAPESGGEGEERPPGEAGGASPYDVGRLLSFSDGVFAIALTLLVLDIPVPALTAQHSGAALWGALQGLWPKLLGFAISFGVVGLYWLRHHRLFRHIRQVDGRLLWLNLAGLFLVCLVPFTTSLVSLYGDLPLGAEVYCANLAALGVAFAFVRWYGLRQGLIADPDASPHAWHVLVRALVFPALFVPFIVLAPINLEAAYACLALAGPLAALSRRLRRQLDPSS
jgi:uncharacterized membrane protein